MSISQHHHWGIHEHGIHITLIDEIIEDIYFYDFASIEDLFEHMVGIDVINKLLDVGGGFVLVDTPRLASQTHQLTLKAYHTDPKWLTWVALARQ